jgi:hypothetical protein
MGEARRRQAVPDKERKKSVVGGSISIRQVPSSINNISKKWTPQP